MGEWSSDAKLEVKRYRIDKSVVIDIFKILENELKREDVGAPSFGVKAFKFTIRYGKSVEKTLEGCIDEGIPEYLSSIESLTGIKFTTG